MGLGAAGCAVRGVTAGCVVRRNTAGCVVRRVTAGCIVHCVALDALRHCSCGVTLSRDYNACFVAPLPINKARTPVNFGIFRPTAHLQQNFTAVAVS